MQLNVGGNSDFLNMLERDRLESKKISKTNAVTSMLDYDIGAENVHVGPSDYVPWLTDRKWAYIRMEGKSFGDVPLNVELKLEVWDSPNSAGIVIDAVRLAKLALNNGVAGALEAPSSYLMKSPPVQIRDDEAHDERRALHQAARAQEGKAPRRRSRIEPRGSRRGACARELDSAQACAPCASAWSRRSPGRSRTRSTSTSRASPRELRALGHDGDRARAVEPRAPTCRRAGARCSSGADDGGDRARPGGADLAPQQHGRPGRRRARTSSLALARGRLRRRPRLRARRCRASRTSRSATRSALAVATLLLAGAARLPAGQGAARAAARPDRRAPRDLATRRPRPRRERFPGDYRVVSPGVDTELFAPGRKRRLIVLEWRPARAPAARAASSATLDELPGWELVAAADEAALRPARTSRARCVGRVHVAHGARRRRPRATSSREAAIFVPALDGARALRLEADAAGARRRRTRRASTSSPSSRRPRSRGWPRTTSSASGAAPQARARRPSARASPPSPPSSTTLYRGLAAPAPPRRDGDPLADRAVDRRRPAHAHDRGRTTARSPVEELLDHAEAKGLGAIAVTDHNVFGGALEAVELARDREPDRHPRRGGEDRRPGRGDRPLPRGGDPARHVVRRHDRGDPRAGRPRLPPPPVRPAARDPRPGARCTATSPTSTCSRSTTRACSSRRTTTRRSASRASTT